jgi:prepilin-type N-terminal cleavage/methylation domain-containing protein
MAFAAVHRRRGMTLVELLVVLAIMGLLAVTVVPLLVGNRDKKSVRNAADAAESAFNHVATKAMTSPHGAAAWLETGTSGAGSGAAVRSIAFARVPAVASGATTIIANNVTTVTVSLSLSGSFASDLPAPIQFAGIPGVFTALSTTSVTSGTSSVSGPLNRTAWNSAPPLASSAPVPYSIHLPPRPSSFASVTPLPGGVAIDLSSSQIGLNSAATSLIGYKRVAIEYDRTGSPLSVWMSTATSGGSWARQMLTASTPIVLAIGMQSQAGQGWVSTPTEDDPGALWQSSFARWLLIDPRNGSARVIEAGSCTAATDGTTARSLSLAPVVEEFQNSRAGGSQ